MGGVISLDDMLADLELLVNTESTSLHLDLLEHSAAAVAQVMERRLGTAPRIVPSANGPHVLWSGGGTPKVLLVAGEGATDAAAAADAANGAADYVLLTVDGAAGGSAAMMDAAVRYVRTGGAAVGNAT